MLPSVHHRDYINSFDSRKKTVQLLNWTCNDLNYTFFDLSRFTVVEEIIIGNDCFMNVNEFKINNYDHLKSLKIGKNSFTKRKNSSSNDSSRSFHILNCPELKSIEIDEYTFSDYGGGFELKNLPKLHSIMMKSFNFCSSSFIVHGSIFYMFTNRSSEFEFCSIR